MSQGAKKMPQGAKKMPKLANMNVEKCQREWIKFPMRMSKSSNEDA